MESPANVGSSSGNTAVTIIQTVPTTSVVVEATLSGSDWTRTILHTQSDIAIETTVLLLSDPTLTTSTAPDASQTASTSTTPTDAPFVNNGEGKQAQSPKVPIGAIVGGLIGGLILLTMVIVFCLFRRNRRRRQLRMRQIPLPHHTRFTYPTAFPIDHNSVPRDLSKTALNTAPRPRDPLVLANPDEASHHNKIASSPLPKKTGRPGSRDALHADPSDEKAKFGDQVDVVNNSEMTPDMSEDVRLLRVLVRAIEDRPWLSALVGEENTPSNVVVDPPPGYEETNSLLDRVNR